MNPKEATSKDSVLTSCCETIFLVIILIFNILKIIYQIGRNSSFNIEIGLQIPVNGAIIRETEFKCYEFYNDTHCEFHNIYFNGQSFYAYTNKYEDIKPVMINPTNFTPYWKPKQLKKAQLKKIKLEIRKGVSQIIENPYPDNIGHTLLDVLHPLFIKLLMRNYSSSQGFDLYMNKMNYFEIGIQYKKFHQRNREVITNFTKGSVYILDPKPLKFKKMIIIEHLYTGVGRIGQRYINKDFNMPSAIDFNSIQQFRDRFYQIYNVSLPKKRDRILIVNNKRFAIYRKKLKSFANDFGKQYPQFKTSYVNYKEIPFREQLILLSETILYVTAPGTAMLNFIFLTDKTFMYNIGTINMHRKDRYLEESIVESLPYVQVFYYFDNEFAKPYNFTKVNIDLCEIVNNHVIPNNFSRNWKEKGSGLSIIGKKFTYYCGLFPNSCDAYIKSIYSVIDNNYICEEACSWPEPILFNYCYNKEFCKFLPELPFVCDHNYSCKIINPNAN